MAISGPQISGLLEKMLSTDKDFRFMATNDLMAELQKDSIKLDDETERRVTRALLKLLDDKNGEVQNLAVKCLAPLIRRVKTVQIEQVVESLCQNIDSDQDRLRDVSSIALKTVVNELPQLHQGKPINTIIQQILPKLLHSLKEVKRTDSSIKIEIADILSVIVDKFGRQSEINLKDVEDVLFLLIKRERQALRKRAITVLGYLVGAVEDEAYERIVGRVLEGLKTEKDSNALRAYVLAAATISKSSTNLFVTHLAEFIEVLVSFCKKSDDDELKDACVHAFEMFIVRCNKEIAPHLPTIVEICSEMIKYDPNYEYDNEEDEANGEDSMEIDSADNNSDEEADEYSDDDDLSWKARRSAAKCLEALITNKSDRLLEHYNIIAPLLLNRFKEREESVKIDIFHAYESLLKQTRLFLPESLSNLDTAMHNAAFNSEGNKEVTFSDVKLKKIFAEDMDGHQREVLQALTDQVPQLIRILSKQLKSKSATVRLECFALLILLVRALPGALNGHFESLIPAIKAAITEKAADSSTKIDTLNFLHLCFCSHEPTLFYPHLETLIPLIANCANEPFYKVGAISLTTLQSLIIVLKPVAETSTNYLPYVEQIYSVISAKLRLNDIDQEVKERAIGSTGILLSTFGSKLTHHLDEILPVLLDRLKNEMSRQVAVQSFSVIVASNNQVNLSIVLDDLLVQLADFLRKNQRALRISTLTLLSSLITKYRLSPISLDGIERVVRELPAIIIEQDMFTSQLSLKLAKEIVTNFPQAIAPSLNSIITSCVNLVKSSLPVGRLLDCAVELFVAIVQSSIPQKPQFTDLMTELTAPVYSEKTSRQVCHSVAYIMAHSAKANNHPATTTKLISNLIDSLKKQQNNETLHMFALYALGEIGRVHPKAYEEADINPEKIIMEVFNSPTEEIKTIASQALGAVGAGDIEKYLPILLNEIKNQPKRQYLMLHSLKEVIASPNIENKIAGVVDEIWAMLLNHAKSQEESTRNVTAEIFGQLCKINPNKFLLELIQLSKNGNSMERLTAATAFRFVLLIVSSNPIAEQILHDNLGKLLSAIDDPDLAVRRTTIMTLNSAAHNKPRWVKELLPTLLPSLYRETIVNKELIREVEMGPFRHQIDDGLDLRKSAYECMYTLMEHCLDRLDVLQYMNYIEQGLKDQHDIVLLNLLMIVRLANACPTQVAQRVDGFCDLITPLLQSKTRPNSVKQEQDKLDELKRACVRTIHSLKRVPALARSQKLCFVYEFIVSDQLLCAMIKDCSDV